MKQVDIYNVFDDPIPYKDFLIYPIRMRNYIEFFSYSECLVVDKNSVPDPKVISMTYLEYILTNSTKENYWLGELDLILKFCLNLERDFKIEYGYDENQKIFIKVGEKYIYAEDFDEIRFLICEQNMIQLEDYTISKEVRDALKKAQEYKNKSSGVKMASLEDQILCVVSSTAMKVEDISAMTVRKFIKLLERVDHKLHYQIYLQASLSGMVTFKDKSIIKHWMSDLTKNNLNENLISKESVEKKLSNAL